MGSHVILDGYNLIGGSPKYSSEKQKSIEIARESLIEDLRRYKRKKGFLITVVFDGTLTHRSGLSKTSYKGIQVIYSRGVESADDVIVRMVKAGPHGAVVVSSDRELVSKCHQLGAAVISAGDFEDRMTFELLAEAKGEIEDDSFARSVSTKKKGHARKLSKRRRKDRKRLDRL